MIGSSTAGRPGIPTQSVQGLRGRRTRERGSRSAGTPVQGPRAPVRRHCHQTARPSSLEKGMGKCVPQEAESTRKSRTLRPVSRLAQAWEQHKVKPTSPPASARQGTDALTSGCQYSDTRTTRAPRSRRRGERVLPLSRFSCHTRHVMWSRDHCQTKVRLRD